MMLVFGNKLEALIFPALVIFILPLLSYGAETLQPYFSTSGSTIYLIPGEDTTIPCVVENKGSANVMWKRHNGQMLYAERMKFLQDDRITLQDPPGYNITIRNVAVEDEGKYICFINTSPDIVEQVTTVHVNIPPTVVRNSAERIEADLHQNVTLQCTASGKPQPNITWTKETGRLPNGDVSFQGENMTFTNILRIHNGVYRCTASNGIREPDSATVNLHIEYKAVLLNDARTVVHTGRKHTARLACGYDGNPQAEAKWYKRDQLAVRKHTRNRIVEVKRLQNEELSLLIIKNPTIEDFGEYTCAVNNSLGAVNGTYIVTGLPMKPIIASDTHGQFSEVYYLSWTVVSHDVPLRYELLFRLANKTEADWKIINVSADATEKDSVKAADLYSSVHVLEGLKPNTPYEIKIRAENFFGWGNFSKNFIFETREPGFTPPPPTTTAEPTTAPTAQPSNEIVKYASVSKDSNGHTPPPATKGKAKVLPYGPQGPNSLSPDEGPMRELNGADGMARNLCTSLICLLIGLIVQGGPLH